MKLITRINLMFARARAHRIFDNTRTSGGEHSVYLEDYREASARVKELENKLG